MTQKWIKGEALKYGEKADYAYQKLSALKDVLEVEKPGGGFYVFPIFTEKFLNCAGMQKLAEKGLGGVRGLVAYMLFVYKTASLPGSSFARPDSLCGQRGIRFSIAGEEENDVKLGIGRFEQCVKDLMEGEVYDITEKYQPLVQQLLASL